MTTKSKRWGLRLHISAVQYLSWPSSLGPLSLMLLMLSEVVEDEKELLLDVRRRGKGMKSSGWSRSMPAASKRREVRSWWST